MGFSKHCKKPVWGMSSNSVQNAFFDIPHRGETKKHPWDRIPRGRFHTTILSGLFQAGQNAGFTNVVQLRSKRVFRLSPSGRNEKTPLGSNSTRSVSYHHFEWAFPSRAKSRVDERRPIAFKTRFFDFPHRGETKKHPRDRIPQSRFHATILSGLFQAGAKSRVDERRPIAFKTRFFDFPHRGETKKHHWDRIPRSRFHTTILSGLFQAGQKAGLTNVVQLRSRRVFSTFPIGAKRKNTLGIEVFLRFAPMWKVEKTRFERNWTTFVNPAFCLAWKSPLKMVVWNRLCGIRSLGCFFVSPRWRKSKKRVLNAIGRRSSTRLFALLGKAHSKWW